MEPWATIKRLPISKRVRMTGANQSFFRFPKKRKNSLMKFMPVSILIVKEIGSSFCLFALNPEGSALLPTQM